MAEIVLPSEDTPIINRKLILWIQYIKRFWQNISTVPDISQFWENMTLFLDKAYIFAYNSFFFSQVFVRELISNASDAIEKFRYLCMTGEKLGK